MEKEVINSVSNTPEEKPIVSNEKDTVKYETHNKLLGQHKAVQEKMRVAQEIIDKFEAEKRNVEEVKLQEQGEFKKLLTLKDEELGKLKTERDTAVKENQDTWKYDAFYKKLGGTLDNSAYLSFVDLDNIIFNPETREIDEQSVESVVNDFRTKHSRLITPFNNSKLPAAPSHLDYQAKSIGSMNNNEKINKLNEVLGKIL